MKNFFQLFACCVTTNGINRSLILDLQRDIYYPIPNILFEILGENKVFEINKIISENGEENREIIVEYFLYLESKELGFFTDKPNYNLIDIDTNSFYIYNQISNAIVEYSEKLNLKKIIDELTELNCESVELRFYENIDLIKLSTILNLFQYSTLRSVYILIEFKEELTKKDLLQLRLEHSRLKKIIIHSSKRDKIYSDLDYNFTFTKQIIKNNNCCGFISEYDFTNVVKTYTEFTKFNSCLNRKISIDENGNIKNCPSMKNIFGNIKNNNLKEIIKNKDFTKQWNITKDKINTCQDCEFRYICTDCRAFVENPEDNLSKPLKCGYDPYTNKWEEWSKNPIKQKAIKFYDL